MVNLKILTENNQRYIWLEGYPNNYEILKMKYPRFYDRVLEMQAILKAQGDILNEIQIAYEIILNDMFIIHMDENSVSILESFLNIIPASHQTLDERKKILIAHFKGFGKISSKAIREISKEYNLEAETYFDEQDENLNFLLRIKLRVPRNSDEISNYVDNIKILDIRLPAHLKKFYDILFYSESRVGLAEISVFKYHFKHNQEAVDLSDAPDYFVDDDGNMLLDDGGNIIIDEDNGRSDTDVVW